MKQSRLLSFHNNSYLDPAEIAETRSLELRGLFWSNARGDLEVTCSTLKTAKEPLEVFRLSRSFLCRGSHFFVRTTCVSGWAFHWLLPQRRGAINCEEDNGEDKKKRKIFHMSFFIGHF